MKYYPPFGSTDPDAHYVDRNTAGAQRGSAIPAKMPEMVQREIVAVITNSGIAPDDEIQLAQAIQSQRVNYAVAAGTANAITATITPAPAAIVDGFPVRILLSATNTGAVTLKLNSFAVAPIVYRSGRELFSGEFKPGGIVTLVRSGSTWVIENEVEYFERQTPKGQRAASAFTGGLVKSDIDLEVRTIVQSVDVSATTYIDANATAAFRNSSADLCSYILAIELIEKVSGTKVGADGPYIGAASASNFQIPLTAAGRWQGLDPLKTYTIRLIAKKGSPYGPLQVLDTRISATSE